MRLRMISSLRFMPPEKVLSGLEMSSPSPTTSARVSTRCAVLRGHAPVERPVAVEAVDGDVEADVLLAGEVRVQARVLEDDPDVATDARCVGVEVVPGDGDRALVLARVVVRIEIVVVLPAPLGPRNANSSPGATSKLMSSTAGSSLFLYRLVRRSTRMMGSMPATMPAEDGGAVEADGGSMAAHRRVALR